MQQIINFILRNKTFLLFLLLFSIALSITFQSHSYHKSKFINSANFFTGGIYESVNNISGYFNLKKENELLVEENKRLKSILYNTETNTLKSDYNSFESQYELKAGKVYKNSYSSTNNYLTINVGQRDSVTQDMGVITSKGIVGIIDKTSNKFARVMSVLHSKTRINAQLKASNHYGSLRWDGVSPNIVQLTDVQKQAQNLITIGDTIVTGGKSTIFPKGIPIGTIKSFKEDTTENYLEIEVILFNDMTNIGHVYVIKNLDAKEIESLNNPDE